MYYSPKYPRVTTWCGFTVCWAHFIIMGTFIYLHISWGWIFLSQIQHISLHKKFPTPADAFVEPWISNVVFLYCTTSTVQNMKIIRGISCVITYLNCAFIILRRSWSALRRCSPVCLQATCTKLGHNSPRGSILINKTAATMQCQHRKFVSLNHHHPIITKTIT